MLQGGFTHEILPRFSSGTIPLQKETLKEINTATKHDNEDEKVMKKSKEHSVSEYTHGIVSPKITDDNIWTTIGDNVDTVEYGDDYIEGKVQTCSVEVDSTQLLLLWSTFFH